MEGNNANGKNEELAGMIQRQFADLQKNMGEGFEKIDTRFNSIDTRFDTMDTRLDTMDARLGRLEFDVHELRGEIVYRHEFEDALSRIKYLEKKLGIESGA